MHESPSEPDVARVYEERHSIYASFGNGSLVDVVRSALPPQGRLLDVGCASGGLLAALRPHASYLAGIEISPSAAERAMTVADHVVVGDITSEGVDPGGANFDVVVLADVVEHVMDPLAVVQRAAEWCSPGGAVVVSVPNVAHWRARIQLGRGRWDYADSGTFDRGHVRFFTRTTLVQLLEEGGLTVEAIVPVVPALRNHAGRLLRRLPGRAVRQLEREWQTLGRLRPELLSFQFLVVARHQV